MATAEVTAEIPLWGLASAIAAPVLLVGGWTLAAHLQSGGFDPIVGTISALAARDADHRWVMTGALAGLGLAHVVSALALHPAAWPGRMLLATGGAATLMVAAAPIPSGGGSSWAHTVAAAVAFICLTAWPAAASRPSAGRRSPAWPWRRPVGLAVLALLLAALVWFFLELKGDGDRIGLTERILAGGQALWPLVAIVLSRRADRRPST